MEPGLKRTQCDYTLAFKLSVVDQIEKGELTYKEAQRRYGIQGLSTVLGWLRKHGRQHCAHSQWVCLPEFGNRCVLPKGRRTPRS